MGFEVPPQNVNPEITDTGELSEKESLAEKKKRIIKKALNKVAVFMMAGMMLEASGAGELIRIELGLVSGEKIERIDKEKRIRELLGERVLELMSEASKEEKSENVSEGIEIDALPSIDGELPPEEIRDYLGAFPKHWVNGEVSSIKFRDREGISADTEAAFFKLENRTDGPVEFYKRTKADTIPALTYNLAHEIAHANDWLSDNELSYEERLELVTKIADRVEAQDRYKSSYVESITAKDEKDEKAAMSRKVREYWAEISAVYALEPSALDIKDFSIVDAVVRKNDPDFKVGSIKEKRNDIVTKTVKDPKILKLYGFSKN